MWECSTCVDAVEVAPGVAGGGVEVTGAIGSVGCGRGG